MLVINNPVEFGFTDDKVFETLMKFAPDYFCFADEISNTGTYHKHVFLYSHSPIRFNTVKSRFSTAHIEKALGSAKENRAYVSKTGAKWEGTEKAETSVVGTFVEYGELPEEKAEKNYHMYQLLENIKDGQTTANIIDNSPNFAFKVREIDILRQTLLAEKHTVENRNIIVSYIYGATGTGKTHGIYQKHDPRDICRITNYRKGKGVLFDSYNTHDVLVFEEFNSQIPIEEMLSYLDIYPVSLPARYNDRIACFTHVYITSNLSLMEQYKSIQYSQPTTWQAFLRRIYTVSCFVSKLEQKTGTVEDYFHGFPFSQQNSE